MKRRTFLKQASHSMAGVSFLPSAMQSATAKQTHAQTKRNVILLLFDDMRRDSLGHYGGQAVTPHIDALMSESVIFDNACTTTGLCSPSRAALFTGKWGHQTGLDDNCHIWHSRLMHLKPSQPTLLEKAQNQGYQVGYFGKWHLGPDGPIERGADKYSKKGFERWAKRLPSKPDFSITQKYDDKNQSFREKREYYGLKGADYADTRTARDTREVIEFLSNSSTKNSPFFLTLGFHGPHPPYLIPSSFADMYDYREMPLPPSYADPHENKPRYQRDVLWPWHNVDHMSNDDWRKTIAYSLGYVSLLDRAVGDLVSALKRNRQWENTMIIFASDQGSMLGEHGLYDKGPYCYDELMRIPLSIYLPGAKPKRIAPHVSLMDLHATLLEWMGCETSENSHSQSLLPLMQEGEHGWKGKDEAFYRYEWYNGKWYGIRAIRTPAYKYCWNPVGIDEFYDLQNDPHEIQNQYKNPHHKEQLQKHQERLLHHLKETNDPSWELFQNHYLVK